MKTLKIMTFNVRTNCESDGENRFFNRAPFIAEWLRRVKPDVIGMQEVRPEMYARLVEDLSDYIIVGGGRGADRGDEAVPIAFRKDAFFLTDLETFWLSSEPHTPGSRYTGDQSGCPRVCTSATLKPRDGEPFRVYNIHTDHVGVFARVLASNQLLQKINEDNLLSPMPAFITGDFNDLPDSLCIKTILCYRGGFFTDLSADVGGTFHNYGRLSKEEKIDYIFAENGTKCLSCEKMTDHKNGLWLSDHYPVMAEVEL